MASLTALLSQQITHLPTRKALVVCGLQNDLVSRDGKLPVVSTVFLDRLRRLVPAFREHGHVIWVRSQFEADRRIFDGDLDKGDASRVPGESCSDHLDEELYLSTAGTRGPCCLPGSRGFAYSQHIADIIDPDRDMQLLTTHYSAFGETSLLTMLRSKLITSLYIAGCVTNLSVFATAMDAARYGIKIAVVEDCLGYHRKSRHDMALKQLREYVEARVVSSDSVLRELSIPSAMHDEDASDSESVEQSGLEFGGRGLDDEHHDMDSLLVAMRSPQLSQRLMAMHFSADEQHTHSATSDRPKSGPREVAPHKRPADESIAVDRRTRKPSDGQAKPCRPIVARGGQCSRGSACAEGVDLLKGNHLVQGMRSQGSNVDEDPLPPMVQQPVMTDETCSRNSQIVSTENRRHRLQPLFGVGSEAASAGSIITFDLLPPELAQSIFQRLNDEVVWQRMTHQTGEVPRLVNCQASVQQDGSTPVYRHPSDQTLPVQAWTPAVDEVRRAAEDVVGHELNHCLIQLYRGGTDFISEHSDKTLDIAKDTHIVNVSFGAQRAMRFRTKRGASDRGPDAGRTTFRVPLPHNSLLALSPRTNAEYLHGINPDKRSRVELGAAETAFGGRRISLTFRCIGTFLSADASRIWGQGATAKTRDRARPVVNGDEGESERLVRAFGRENRASVVAWEATYGKGSDVLHLKEP